MGACIKIINQSPPLAHCGNFTLDVESSDWKNTSVDLRILDRWRSWPCYSTGVLPWSDLIGQSSPSRTIFMCSSSRPGDNPVGTGRVTNPESLLLATSEQLSASVCENAIKELISWHSPQEAIWHSCIELRMCHLRVTHIECDKLGMSWFVLVTPWAGLVRAWFTGSLKACIFLTRTWPSYSPCYKEFP